jgi:hypothetical protein
MSCYSFADVGSLHPQGTKQGSRITWTSTEIQIAGEWCAQFRLKFPDNRNVAAKCLEYISSNREARVHFHPHHIFDSTRLRWGIDKYGK